MLVRQDISVLGAAPDGSAIHRVEIADGGARGSVLTWGGTLQEFRLEGLDHSLVLGSSDLAANFGPMLYFEALVGPVANRIANGRMPIGDGLLSLDRNEGGRTTLHGGRTGFGQRNWEVRSHDRASVTLGLHHTDGLGGFPGNIEVTLRYALGEDGALSVEISAQSDAPTWFGPVFHGYWNLVGTRDLSSHRLTIPAQEYLPVGSDLIPVGAPEAVAGTDFDYRVPRPPGPALDHNFCLGYEQGVMRPACRLEAAGVRLDVETTEVGLQVYTGGRLSSAPFAGHHGQPYGAHAGIALEPQFWPDTPNHPDYPSSALLPGQTHAQVSRFAATRTSGEAPYV